VTIAVSDAHVERMPTVVAALQQAGVSVEQTLDTVGAIVGSVDEANVDALSRVTGVDSVEREGHFQLPPPSSPIQ
jgi:hypothetical protein